MNLLDFRGHELISPIRHDKPKSHGMPHDHLVLAFETRNFRSVCDTDCLVVKKGGSPVDNFCLDVNIMVGIAKMGLYNKLPNDLTEVDIIIAGGAS